MLKKKSLKTKVLNSASSSPITHFDKGFYVTPKGNTIFSVTFPILLTTPDSIYLFYAKFPFIYHFITDGYSIHPIPFIYHFYIPGPSFCYICFVTLLCLQISFLYPFFLLIASSQFYGSCVFFSTCFKVFILLQCLTQIFP